MKWQTGDYDRYAEFQFILPHPFLMLCRLLAITPEKMLRDFMDCLSCESLKPGPEIPRAHLLDYVISQGYGQELYAGQELRELFREMEAMSILFPAGGKRKQVDRYVSWKSGHYKYLFRKWAGKQVLREEI